jgi:ABC-type transport system involved in cytochrome bd biosynthesis fused ATPase/permease subunit
VDDKNTKVFNRPAANELIAQLGSPENQQRLQSTTFEDFPEITVTKFIDGDGGSKVPIVRNFTKLSLGQQQSILLSILVYSKSKYPLLIDQPEDNLDSEFIYRTIVRNLKRIKEYRQIIIVTHNANIAVLGDTELIVPLKSTNDKAFIRHRGSIDNEDTKAATCDILEGSAQAFKRRAEIYGL